MLNIFFIVKSYCIFTDNLNNLNMAIYHLPTTIAGILRNCNAKKLDRLFDMSNGEAKKQLLALQAKGHKLLPSEKCKHFDPFEHGCQCRFYDKDGNKISL